MPDYRRWFVPGGTYFFTVVTYRRRPLFRSKVARNLLGGVIRSVCRETPFTTVGLVLLHDHLHALWSLPPGDDRYSDRWRAIKGDFTERWIGAGGTEAAVTPSQARRGHRGVWQRRFWEHLIRDEGDFERHLDYIHYNPVKHGYAERPLDWPHSTFHKYVRRGVYPPEWGRTEPPGIAGMDCE